MKYEFKSKKVILHIENERNLRLIFADLRTFFEKLLNQRFLSIELTGE